MSTESNDVGTHRVAEATQVVQESNGFIATTQATYRDGGGVGDEGFVEDVSGFGVGGGQTHVVTESSERIDFTRSKEGKGSRVVHVDGKCTFVPGPSFGGRRVLGLVWSSARWMIGALGKLSCRRVHLGFPVGHCCGENRRVVVERRGRGSNSNTKLRKMVVMAGIFKAIVNS